MTSSTTSLFKKIKDYSRRKGFDLNKIQKAYNLAKKLHKSQKRKSGEPYIIHPLSTAYYLTKYGADEETIIAALLHDTVEDTDYSLDEVKKDFGKDIAKLIEGVTKITKKRFRKAETIDLKIESLRKWLEIIQEDVRVAVIRLADRLHNMETLSYHRNPAKETLIAKETLDVFVKIADKLGIKDLMEKLEELCLFYLDPKNYHFLNSIRKKEKVSSRRYLPKIQEKLLNLDKKKKIIDINYESPPLLKMHNDKIQSKDNIKGALPIRFSITAKNTEDCYYILYLIHKLWKAESSSFKDFINSPTPSGYQGLYTKVIYKNGRDVKFKIRTKEMEKYRKYGITLTCFSKDRKRQKLFSWIKNLPYITKRGKNQSEVFWNQLKNDVLDESIIVHTDKDDRLLLPSNSTALDAAFYSYEDKAFYLDKTFINGEIAPFNKSLKQNDTVHFHFNKKLTVNYKWLDEADTALTDSFIKKGLKKIGKDKKIYNGKEILNKILMKEGLGFIDEIGNKNIDKILKNFNTKNKKELFSKIAEGEINPADIALIVGKKKNSKKPFLVKLNIDLNNEKEEPVISEIINKFSLSVKKYSFVFRKMQKRISTYVYIDDKKKIDVIKNLIRRNASINKFTASKSLEWLFSTILLFGVIFFWGLEYSIIYYSYLTTDIKPLELTLIRLWVITIPLLIWMGVKLTEKKNKIIPIFDSKIIISSFFLLLAIFFRCLALFGTAVSTYMVFYRNQFFILTLSALPLSAFLKNKKKSFFALLGAIIANFIVLYFTPNWAFEYRVYLILSLMFFPFFLFFSDIFKKKHSVYDRYYQLVSITYFYCSIFMSIFCFLFTDITIDRLIFLIRNYFWLFSMIGATVFIPYVLTYLLISKPNIDYYRDASFGTAWIIGVVAEALIFGTFFRPDIIVATISGTIMTISIFLVVRIYKKRTYEKL